VWAEVLGVEQVGVNDNYFSLGGDSILCLQIVSRAQRAGLQFTARQLFQEQTVARLAMVAKRIDVGQPEQELVSGPVELTPIQRWFFAEPLSERWHFNQSVLLEFRQHADPRALEQAVQGCLRHHDALRMRYFEQDSVWTQVNQEKETQPVFIIEDLSSLEPSSQTREIEQRAAKWQQSLSLEQGPQVRAVFFSTGSAAGDRLLLVIHHLVVDAVSWQILLEDLQSGYEQALRGEAIKLPPKTSSYQKWARRLPEYAGSQTLQAESNYWLEQADACREAADGFAELDVAYVGETSALTVGLDEEQTLTLLRDVPTAFQVQINDALVTALAVALTRWRGSRKVLISLEGHGREELFTDVNLTRTVGWFTTLYPLALEVPVSDNSISALRAIKEQLRRVPRGGTGYGALCYLSGDLGLARRLSVSTEICFNYLGQLDGFWPATSPFALAQENSGLERSPRSRCSHAIEIEGSVSDGRLQMTWTFNERKYPLPILENVARDFIGVLGDLISQCHSSATPAFTPSDFPLANLDAAALALVLQKATDASKK
jgi:non-ribosomal peptide synthase protein (TIGR01720 family)